MNQFSYRKEGRKKGRKPPKGGSEGAVRRDYQMKLFTWSSLELRSPQLQN
jgi:hypothetical protein